MLVASQKGASVANQDKMSGTEQPKRPADSPQPLGKVVELARDVLRERGLTDDQIDVLLKRRRAPDNLR